jgi:hypothetical protein
MTESAEQAVQVGRTRWRRFGIVGGAGLGAVAIVGYLAATGALALSFAFSGIPFTLSATELRGENFVQYAFPDRLGSGDAAPLLEGAAGRLINGSGSINNVTQGPDGNFYASDTVTQLGSATIDGLAQQICAPTPLGVAIRVTIAGTGDATRANNLVIQAPALTANEAAFNNIVIGTTVRDALTNQGFPGGNEFTDPYGARSGQPIGNSFAQRADNVVLSNIDQIGVGTEAGTFIIDGLELYAEFVGSC